LHGKGVEGRFEWTVSVDSERKREREREVRGCSAVLMIVVVLSTPLE